jgi:Tfp pilus assembly protein PilX
MNEKRQSLLHRRCGIALPTVLIILTVLALISVTAFSLNASEQKMAVADSDYHRALQAADSAVAQGEWWLEQQTQRPPASNGCSNPSRACSDTVLVWPASSPIEDWLGFDWIDNGLDYCASYDPDASARPRMHNCDLARVGRTPRYVIEELGPDLDGSLVAGQESMPHRWYYRVTGQASGAEPRMTSMAQSVYAKVY